MKTLRGVATSRLVLSEGGGGDIARERFRSLQPAEMTETWRKRKAGQADLELEQLSFKDDLEMRKALKEVGIDAGPIDSSNRLA